MHKLMSYVCSEVDELESKIAKDGGLTKADMQYLDVLMHTKKDMLACEQMDSKYSNDDGMSRASYRSSYDDGYSREDRASFARGRMNAPRDSMGRYSGASGYSRHGDEDRKVIEVLDDLRGIVRDLPNDAKYEVERIIKKHEDVYS